MGSDIFLHVLDPERGTVVLSVWVGRRHTLERLLEILQRPPDFSGGSGEFWGSITESEALSIADGYYGGRATPDNVRRWLAQYPPTRYWWNFDRNY